MTTFYNTPTPLESINKEFKIPLGTLRDWEKADYENWRATLLDRVKLFVYLKEESLKKLLNIFTKQELQALWGALNGTLITVEDINKEHLANSFQNYCYYNKGEAGQFIEDTNITLEEFSMIVSSKILRLTEFEIYTLIDNIKNDLVFK